MNSNSDTRTLPMKADNKEWEIPWRLFVSEMIGTAVLLLGGLSLVIFMFGDGTPMDRIVPDIAVRRSITGFLFGCVGVMVTLSDVGKESGAHINPAVTLGFWLMQKIDSKTALGYALSQLTGAFLGCLPLIVWGAMGRSVDFGATVPGDGYPTMDVLMGEVTTTFALVTLLLIFIGFRTLRPFTPFMVPFLYAVMVPLEASISGTSTNPARTFGPAIISGRWEGWWIYWVGPLVGAIIAVLVCGALRRRIEVAKIYYFESDRRRVFRRMAGGGEGFARPTPQ